MEKQQPRLVFGEGRRILETEDFYVWGCSPIYDDQGTLHVYYSRWPRQGGFHTWQFNCEVHHATATSIHGEFEYQGPVLTSAALGEWDSGTIHNPTIQKVGEQYYLFYMANDVTAVSAKRDDMLNMDQQAFRKAAAPLFVTKQIGVAVSDSPYGPFQRSKHNPVISHGENGEWDDIHASNPAYVMTPGGKSRLYYKGYNQTSFLSSGGNRKYGFAEADSPLGPYTKFAGNPVIDMEVYQSGAQCEDAYIRYDKAVDKYKIIMRDMGIFGKTNGLYQESGDGISWSQPEMSYGPSRECLPAEETSGVDHPLRLERPQLLLRNGNVEALFCALSGGCWGASSSYILPIESSLR